MSRAATITVAVIIVALLGLSTWFVLDRRAERAAEVEAANTQVRAEISERYGELATAARAGADISSDLQVNLQEHLTVSERSDEEIAEERESLEDDLGDAAEALQELATAPLPDIPEMADESAISGDLEELAAAQGQAGELGSQLAQAATGVDAWSNALTALREQADRYVETVEGQPETSDPDRLQEQWRDELELLREYREAAEAAAEIPGLEPLAEAYLTYIDANIEFAEEAIELLEAEEIDAYNERLREVFGDDDPFGFQEAAGAATIEALDLGVLGDLTEARDAAASYALEVERRQRELAPATPAPDPTP